MKKLLTTLLLLLLTIPTWAQQTFKEKIAQHTCECLEGKSSEGLSPQQTEFELGICLIMALNKNKEAMKAELGSDSINDIDLERFGEDVGVEMLTVCPYVFLNFVNNDEEEEAGNYQIELGKIKSIDYNPLTTVNVESGDGSILKFIWLTEFEGDELLLKNKYKGKWVNIFYFTVPLFDAKQKKYIEYKVINGIELGE